MRENSNYRHLEQPGVELAFGDLRNRESVDEACSGVTHIVATANAVMGRTRGDELKTVDGAGYSHLIEAAKKHGIQHLIWVSVPVTRYDSKVPQFWWKRANEQRIQNSDIPHTIFRAAMFSEVWPAMLGSQIPLKGETTPTLERPFWFLKFFRKTTGSMIEKKGKALVAGTPFPEWMKENVFEPIGMSHTVVRASPNQIVPNRSTGYSPTNQGAGFSEVTDLGGAMGAGGIHTTLGDLAKWIQNLSDPRVGSEEIIKEMMTPFDLKNGSSTEYGLGLFVQEYKGLKYVHHGGSDLAHRSMLIYFPEIDAAVVTQSNHAAFRGNIAQKNTDMFFEDYMEEDDDPGQPETDEPEEFEYDPENFDPLTGRYELSVVPGFVLTFSRDGDRIYTQATGQPEVDLTATSDSTFSLVGVQADITFHRNEDGTADSLTLHQNGDHIAKKIEFELDFAEMREYTGRYFSEEVETLYHIALKDSTLLLQHYQLDEDIELSPSDKDKFGAGFPLSSIVFVRNEAGDITGFKGSSGRTRDVLFEKWRTIHVEPQNR